MRVESDLRRLAGELATTADRRGLQEFHVHGFVRDAFRNIQQTYLAQLDKRWDAEFELLRTARRCETRDFDIHNTGGEKMTKPLKEFASGSIRATIWENEREKDNQKFTTHTIRVERTYKDQDDNWQATNGFRQGDLPKVELVVRKAFEFLTMRERQPREEENGESLEA